MNTAQPAPGDRPSTLASGRSQLAAWLFGALFVLIGAGAILWLLLAVANAPAIHAALTWTPAQGDAPPSPIIAFLTQFGIVLPLLVLGLGVGSIWLGVRLFSRSISAARWAQAALGWLTAAALTWALTNAAAPAISRFAQPTAPPPPFDSIQVVTALAAAVFFWLARVWLINNLDRVFFGREQLGQRESRVAWNLLIPTLIVFVLVAARPLEQTFIRSLTDKRFASPQAPNFVGLQNYQNLLGIRFDVTSDVVPA